MAIGSTSASPITLAVTRDLPFPSIKPLESKPPQTPVIKPTAKAPDIGAAAPTSRRTSVDQSTGEVVYHVIDDHSGQQISQSPDEAILRIRAYVRQMDATKQNEAMIPKAQAKG
jgi:hypothetical protein